VRVDEAGKNNEIAEIVQRNVGRDVVPGTHLCDALALDKQRGGSQSIGGQHIRRTECL